MSHKTEEIQHNFELQFPENHLGSGFDLIWDEIDKLRNKFDDYIHCEDFDEMHDHVDDLADKIMQISKQGGYNVQIRRNLDEFSQSEDTSPVGNKSDREVWEEDKDNDLVSNGVDKNIKKALTSIKTDLAEEENTKDNQSPSIHNLSPDKQQKSSKDSSPNLNSKNKDASPSKFSNYGRSSKRGGVGHQKTIQEARKIAEEWPKIKEAIQELKESEKVC